MIYDLTPKWLRKILGMNVSLDDGAGWTWRHFCRYGFNPAKTIQALEASIRK